MRAVARALFSLVMFVAILTVGAVGIVMALGANLMVLLFAVLLVEAMN